MASEPRTTGLTYSDLERMFPGEELVRRELIDGQLFVTPSPVTRHQQVVAEILFVLRLRAEEHGGRVLPGPLDTMVAPDTVLEPDVLFYRADRMHLIGERPLRDPPDLVVEVSSPSTRARDLGPKKDTYARFGVREYWFVDLESDRLEVYRLQDGHYGPPEAVGRHGMFRSDVIEGAAIAVDDLLGPGAG